MSSHDILDVFNVQRSEPPKKKKKIEPKKQLSGINRELYQLLGENTPALHLKPTSKFRKRLDTNSKAAAWRWVKFKNNSRDDGLQLSHWMKGIGPSPEKYQFEQYNQKLKLPDPDDVTYERLIKENDEENDWTCEETKYLFKMCKLYDLRWIIINDRYNYQGPARSLEDLKQRFYSVCQKILIDENKILKEAGILDENKTKLIDALNFDKSKEIDRKKYLERLLGRSPAEIAEEESLVIEARRFEQAAQKMLAERAALLHLLDSPASTANISQYSNSQGLAQLYNSLMFTDKSKKRKQEQDTAVTSSAGMATDSKKLNKKQQQQQPQQSQQQPEIISPQQTTPQPENPVAQLLSKKLTAQEEAAYGLSYHAERLQPGVHLRSSKIASYKPSVQTKVNSTLNELGIPNRPAMISKKIVERFDILTDAITTLLETKKQIDSIETEQNLVWNSQ
ncbi:Swc4 protein [Saccharomycopsis crataegensis]|uniref:SWR1-complex protein 4 n=1 Tax=Saccharomycopsis crataegensis TaxID=43959 RepID=A0AAV5QQ67_9ASCO|nr:Swc4 protein [Saccharomycopsis crataegensis]